MSDWYKVYNVAEECGTNGSEAVDVQVPKIKAWLEENFSDLFECTATNSANSTGSPSTSASSTSRAAVSVYFKGFNNKIGFYYGTATGSGTIYNGIGYKTDTTSIYSMTTSTDLSYAASIGTSNIDKLRLKIIRLKNCLIADFYAVGYYKNACRLMIADIDGVKCGFRFTTYGLYVVKQGGEQLFYGGFQTCQTLGEKKNLQKFIFPWLDTWIDGWYETDSIVGDNKPYLFNGKIYIDISGSNSYHGLAIEVTLGDNDLLYGETDEEK
jgi:hypothetical protein